ncbi:Syntaxin-binding protein 3 [Myotis brandtii]|uniref:Syntaxin-binding protein 3 n=1 Tax=Myotis brandtii TaxID=109478 RepID=S7MK94_MYOBR|nr:Syntaxin-binding protein 3 [Myotis brandtii]
MGGGPKKAPETPTIDQAYSKISNSITVEWATVPGATSYLLTAKDGDTVIETTVANSPGTVTGLKAATLYQITVSSISAAGRSQASPPTQAKTVLAAPVLEVSSPSSDSILVQWEAVYMATGFSVSIMRANGLGRIWKENTTNTTLTFTSLDAGTLYTIKAYAWNANGTPGDDSTCNQRTTPETPTIDQAYSKISNSITVEWATVPGATSYLLTAKDGDTVIETTVANSPGTVTGLKAATLYQITVSSISAAGRSQASPPTQAKTVLAAPVLEVSSPSSDSILVQWEAVYMATGFSVSIMRANGLGRIWKENTTNTTLTFTSLDAGTLYTIKAYAWNANGTPGDDSTCNQRTSPRAPGDIQVSFDSGALAASVSWAPTEGASNYTALARSDSSQLSCSTASSGCTISSLRCGTEYLISVSASNDAGSSRSASAGTLKTIACAPGRVTIQEDPPGHLSVSWSNVDLGDYYVAFVKSDDGLEVHCNTSLPRCDFPSECGFTYFISVFAYNRAGQSPLGDVFNYTTAPCCPSDINPVLVSSDRVEMVWSPVRGAELYETRAADGFNVVECNDTAPACTLSALECDTKYNITVYSFSEARGSNTSCASRLITTVPCCPAGLTVTQVTQSVVNVSWTVGTGALTYVTVLASRTGQSQCRTHQNHCLLGCITCGVNYTVALKAISATGLTADCAYQRYASSACCPLGVKLYRLGPNGIRVDWRAARGSANYSTDLYGSKGIFTCSPSAGLSFCDVTEIPCGDVYTVMVSPVAETGLKLTFCPKKIYSEIKATVFDDCKKEDEWKIMLLDEFTTKLLASCCKMTDLLAEGITVVENIYKIREPVRQMKALYFISPTSKSVDCFLRDFPSKSESKYKAAYIYFTDFCPDSLFNKIKSSCSKSIRRCKEINISFIPLESQVYTLDVPDAFYYCYSPDPSNANGKDAVMEAMAEQIVTVCASLDENPGVRYKSKPLNNASKLAQLVEKKLENYYKTDEKSLIKGKTHSQLIIIDRGFDPVSTVLHELTFQAMAYDLLPIENDTYKQVRIRHRHIAVVLEEIPKLMKEISSTKKATEGKTSLSALAQLMKKMPHFRKQITKQVVHLNIAEDCMNKFKSNIEKLCKTEQDLALGTDAEGQKVKDSMRVLLPVLLNKNHDNYDKIRAILLYIFSNNGTTEENLDRLIQNVKIENESDMIRNWSYLGVPIVPPSPQGKPSRKDRSAEETFQLSRWTPYIKDILEDAIDNRLDSKEWPYCSQCPAVWNGSGAVSARQKPRGNYLEDRKNGSTLIVFVIGGITYSEMRCAYEVSQAHKSCGVIIGSTHILTPKKLLDDIKMLNKSKDKVSIMKDE